MTEPLVCTKFIQNLKYRYDEACTNCGRIEDEHQFMQCGCDKDWPHRTPSVACVPLGTTTGEMAAKTWCGREHTPNCGSFQSMDWAFNNMVTLGVGPKPCIECVKAIALAVTSFLETSGQV